MMKILHVISTLAPTSGGPTAVVLSLASAQAECGNAVSICTTDRGNPSREILLVDDVRRLLPSDVSLHIFPVNLTSILYSGSMKTWLRKHITEFDIVHIHGLYRFPPTYAAREAYRHGVPHLIRTHGNLDPFLYRQSSRSVLLKRVYEHIFDLPNMNHAGAIHYTTEEERERTSFLRLRAPAVVVPNGIDWAVFSDLPQRGGFRSTYALGDCPLVLFLGRLHFVKGLDLLVRAFEMVHRAMPRAILAIVGPENDGFGTQVRRWVAQAGLNDSIKFVEPLAGPEVIQCYVDSDVFVLPSYTENFGTSVVEAMACGVPVVISDQVKIHPVVTVTKSGIVTRCDSKEIGDALLKLLREPDLRRSLGRAGRETAKSRFSWEVIVGTLSNEYRNIINRTAQTLGRKRRASRCGE